MQENIKRIIAVRHGQSVGNIARHEAFLRDNNSFYEDPNFLDINPDNYELSQLGVEQSKKAGEFLRQVLLLNPGVYFSSNNFRTRQTDCPCLTAIILLIFSCIKFFLFY